MFAAALVLQRAWRRWRFSRASFVKRDGAFPERREIHIDLELNDEDRATIFRLQELRAERAAEKAAGRVGGLKGVVEAIMER